MAQSTFTPKPIPTLYAGIELKSRFEAQAALLFDRLGWTWEYEPQSYMLPDGRTYTPDFLIPEQHMFIETRGTWSVSGMRQLMEFEEMVRAGKVEIPAERNGKVSQFVVLMGPGEIFFSSTFGAPGDLFILAYCPNCEKWSARRSLAGRDGCTLCESFEYAKCVLVTVREGRILLNGHESPDWELILR